VTISAVIAFGATAFVVELTFFLAVSG